MIIIQTKQGLKLREIDAKLDHWDLTDETVTLTTDGGLTIHEIVTNVDNVRNKEGNTIITLKKTTEG